MIVAEMAESVVAGTGPHETVVRKVQQILLIGGRPFVVAPVIRKSGPPIDLFFVQEAVLHKHVGTYEQGVAGKGGDAAIRRIAVNRRSRVERQYLPVGLARLREEVGEPVCPRPEVADPVRRRKRGHMKQDACPSLFHCPSLLNYDASAASFKGTTGPLYPGFFNRPLT